MSEWISPGGVPARSGPSRRCQDWAALPSPAVKNEFRSQQREGAADDAVEAGLADAEVGAHRGGVLVVELGQLGLDARARPRPRPRPARRRARRPGRDLVVALVDVGDEQHRLGRSAAQRLRSASGAPSGDRDGARRAAGLQRGDHLAQPRLLGDRRLVAAARLLRDAVERAARPARGRRRPARSRSSRCRAAGRRSPRGGRRSASSWARTTWTIASVSRMFARNWLPRPSPLCAPATRPAMSWKSIVSQTISEAPTVRRPRRGARRGTGTTATFGSIVVNG